MPASVDHVIVLALENRSFDHMLGFLRHPDPAFDGLGHGGPFTNPGWRGGPSVEVSADAKPVLPVDPDHSHAAVMQQLDLRGAGAGRHATNQGFVASYEEKGRGLTPPQFDGLVAPLANWWARRQAAAKPIQDRGPLVMRCQDPGEVPVLATLALQFAVCTRWFASVPGETWPNRNFMHAATSDGMTDIEVRPYTDRTIFEVLEDDGRSWHVYHDDTPQIWAFPHLWESAQRRGNWFPFGEFARHVEQDRLPHYSFIEPNHRPPVHIPPATPQEHNPSNSQHPGNNKVANDAYDGYRPTGVEDFRRGEQLVASIYETLRARPQVFERSLLLVTYDEHGGLYDHVAPPTGVHAPGDPPSSGLIGSIIHFVLRRKSAAFDFTMYGPRVPAVVVSPHIPAGTISDDPRDHASIPATLRALFAPTARHLTHRDEHAAPFHELLTLDQPRRGAALPDLSARKPPVPPATREALLATPPAGPEPPVPDYYQDFVELADQVGRELAKEAPPTAARALPRGELGPRARAREVTAAFTLSAEEARQSEG